MTRGSKVCSTLAWVVVLLASIEPSARGQITFQYVYDSRNQLVRAIDSTGIAITYTYDEVGNILNVSRSTIGNIPPPSISNVTPNRVNQGDTVQLSVSGASLLGAQVATTHTGITVLSAFGEDTKATVNLAVASTATLGNAVLSLTTITGSAPINITVVGPRPRITSIAPAEGPSTEARPLP